MNRDPLKSCQSKLSPRQTEVLGRVARGMMFCDIARELDISVKSVRQYHASGMVRLEAYSLADLKKYFGVEKIYA